MKHLKKFKIFEYKKSLQINSYDELLSILKEYNIPLNIWGTYGYKTINHLWEEIKEEECVLSIVNNEIHRNVQFIGAKIIYEKDGIKYKLCEDRAEFKDGRIRIRGIVHSVAEKFKADEDPTKALIRGIKEELGLNINKNQFIYYNKEDIENNEDYPGIKSFHTGYLYFIKINDEQFKPQYIEYQEDKTIYFVWRRIKKRHAGYYPLPLGGDVVTFEGVENEINKYYTQKLDSLKFIKNLNVDDVGDIYFHQTDYKNIKNIFKIGLKGGYSDGWEKSNKVWAWDVEIEDILKQYSGKQALIVIKTDKKPKITLTKAVIFDELFSEDIHGVIVPKNKRIMLENKSYENKDIVITIPSYIKWNDYEKELDKVKDGKEVLNFKVNHLPKKTNIGNKCYMVYNGEIIGWMKIVGLTENEFVCTTTGKKWKGKFIQRSGEFHRIDPITYKGFQGFRYI